MAADGTITIDTSVDRKGIKVGTKDIEASVKRMASTVNNVSDKTKIAIQKQIDSLTKLNNQYGQQEKKVNSLKQKVEELSRQKIETESFKKLSKESDELMEKVAAIEAQLKQWTSIGISEDSKAFKDLNKELDDIVSKIEEIDQIQQKMKKSGTAYEKPENQKGYRDTFDKLTNEEQRLLDMRNRLNTSFASVEQKLKEVGEEAQKSGTKMRGFAKAAESFSGRMITSGLNGMKMQIKSVGRVLDNLIKKFMRLSSSLIVGGLKKISSGIFAIQKSSNKTTLSIKTLLKYALGIRTLYALFGKMRSAAVEGFQNLAQYSNTTNTSISSLKSSLTQLKNALATAFNPILTVVSPILVKFINILSQALTYLGMFIAALTGQTTFTKAVGVQEDYAASLSDTADNAKKAEKALKGYLSPLDEINKYEADTNSDVSSGGGGYSSPSAGSMFEEVPITSSIKSVTDKIKKFIKNEDWEGLGKYVAKEINKGMQHIYNEISWEKVGPKITNFVQAFTQTFNSLVKYLDFDLLGRTIGTGINTAVRTANLLIDDNGIDFRQIGRKLSQGLRGAVREISWTELGNLIGNYFMISWKIFNGFVTDMSRKNDAGLTGWNELGQALAKAINGMSDKIDFSQITYSIATGLNGIFEILDTFADDVEWDKLADEISDGFNTAFTTLNWEQAGKSLNNFIGKLTGFLVKVLNDTDWEEFGEGLGELLAEIDWDTYLWDMIIAIKDAIGDLFDGLEESGTAGKIAAFIGKAFIAVKIADITGLDNLVKLLVGTIGKKLINSESVASLSGSLTETLGDAASSAAGSFSGLASNLGPLVGTAGLIVLAGTAAAFATSKLAGMIEAMQGGNGVGGTFGNTMDNFIQVLQGRGDIISGSATEIWELKESLEKEDMTAAEKADATQQLINKLGEMGVTSDQATQAFETLRQKGLITDDMFDILRESIALLGDETSNMAEKINLGSQSAEESYETLKIAVGNLTNQLHLGIDEQGQLLNALERTVDSGGTAQDAYNAIIVAVENMGGNVESAAKIFSELFPDAVQTTKESVNENFASAQETVSKSTEQMKEDAESNLSDLQEAAENSSTASNASTVSNWGNSSEEVRKNVRQMKLDVSSGLGEVDATVRSHFTSQYNIMTKKWELSGEKIAQLIESMNTSVSEKLKTVVSTTSSAGTKMGNGLKNGITNASNSILTTLNNIVQKVNNMVNNINNSVGGIERAFTFSYNFTNPVTGSSRWGRYSLSLPRVNSIPYLASGAVIPPQNEFLAVLGDQKQGNNIEAPESLIRKIVREESGNQKGGQYQFTAQLNRRTIFDEMIEEAKLRQDQNGFNPFLLT